MLNGEQAKQCGGIVAGMKELTQPLPRQLPQFGIPLLETRDGNGQFFLEFLHPQAEVLHRVLRQQPDAGLG